MALGFRDCVIGLAEKFSRNPTLSGALKIATKLQLAVVFDYFTASTDVVPVIDPLLLEVVGEERNTRGFICWMWCLGSELGKPTSYLPALSTGEHFVPLPEVELSPDAFQVYGDARELLLALVVKFNSTPYGNIADVPFETSSIHVLHELYAHLSSLTSRQTAFSMLFRDLEAPQYHLMMALSYSAGNRCFSFPIPTLVIQEQVPIEVDVEEVPPPPAPEPEPALCPETQPAPPPKFYVYIAPSTPRKLPPLPVYYQELGEKLDVLALKWPKKFWDGKAFDTVHSYLYETMTAEWPKLATEAFLTASHLLEQHGADADRLLRQMIIGRCHPSHFGCEFFNWLSLAFCAEGSCSGYFQLQFSRSADDMRVPVHWRYAQLKRRNRDGTFDMAQYRDDADMIGMTEDEKVQLVHDRSVRVAALRSRLGPIPLHGKLRETWECLENRIKSLMHGPANYLALENELNQPALSWLDDPDPCRNAEFADGCADFDMAEYLQSLADIQEVYRVLKKIVCSAVRDEHLSTADAAGESAPAQVPARAVGHQIPCRAGCCHGVFSRRSGRLNLCLQELAVQFRVSKGGFKGIPADSPRLKESAVYIPGHLKAMTHMFGYSCVDLLKWALLHEGCRDTDKNLETFLVFLSKAARSQGFMVDMKNVAGVIIVTDVPRTVPPEPPADALKKRKEWPNRGDGSDIYFSPCPERFAYMEFMKELLEKPSRVFVWEGYDDRAKKELQFIKGIEAHWVPGMLAFQHSNKHQENYRKVKDSWVLNFSCRSLDPAGYSCKAKAVWRIQRSLVEEAAARLGFPADFVANAKEGELKALIFRCDLKVDLEVTTEYASAAVCPMVSSSLKRYEHGPHCHAFNQLEALGLKDPKGNLDRPRKPKMYDLKGDVIWHDIIEVELQSGEYSNDDAGARSLYEKLVMKYTAQQFPWQSEQFVQVMRSLRSSGNGKFKPALDSDSLAAQKAQADFYDFKEIKRGGMDSRGLPLPVNAPIQMSCRPTPFSEYTMWTTRALMYHGSRSPVLHIDGTFKIVREKVVITICTQLATRKVVPVAIAVAPIESAQDFAFILSMFSELAHHLFGHLPDVCVIMADGISNLDAQLSRVYPYKLYKRVVVRAMCFYHVFNNLEDRFDKLRPSQDFMDHLHQIVYQMNGAKSRDELVDSWSVYRECLFAKYVDANSSGELPDRSDAHRKILEYFQGTYIYREDLSRWYFGAFQRVYPHLGMWVNRTNNPCENFNMRIKKSLPKGSRFTLSKFGHWLKSRFLESLVTKLVENLGGHWSGKDLDASIWNAAFPEPSLKLWAASERWFQRINSYWDSTKVQDFFNSNHVKPDGVCFLLDHSGILRPFHDSAAYEYDTKLFYRHAAHNAFRVSFVDLVGFQGRAGSSVIDSWKFGRCTCSNWWTQRCCEHVLAVHRVCTTSPKGTPPLAQLKKVQAEMSRARASSLFNSTRAQMRETKIAANIPAPKTSRARDSKAGAEISDDLNSSIARDVFHDKEADTGFSVPSDGDATDMPLADAPPHWPDSHVAAEAYRAEKLGLTPCLLTCWREFMKAWQMKGYKELIDNSSKEALAYLHDASKFFAQRDPTNGSVDVSSSLAECYPFIPQGKRKAFANSRLNRGKNHVKLPLSDLMEDRRPVPAAHVPDVADVADVSEVDEVADSAWLADDEQAERDYGMPLAAVDFGDGELSEEVTARKLAAAQALVTIITADPDSPRSQQVVADFSDFLKVSDLPLRSPLSVSDLLIWPLQSLESHVSLLRGFALVRNVLERLDQLSGAIETSKKRKDKKRLNSDMNLVADYRLSCHGMSESRLLALVEELMELKQAYGGYSLSREKQQSRVNTSAGDPCTPRAACSRQMALATLSPWSPVNSEPAPVRTRRR